MRDINHVIHATADANLSQYVYTKVYAGATASPTINGETINMVAGSSFDILVKSISSTTDVYVLGRRRMLSPIIINQ